MSSLNIVTQPTHSATGPIIITGATQRVGLYCALHLQQLGYQVVTTYRREQENVRTLRERGIDCIAVDFTDLEQTCGFIEQIQTKYPSIRALIHNASVWQKDHPKPVQLQGEALRAAVRADMTLFDDMHLIHSRLPYVLNRALLPQLYAGAETFGGADIIHMSDFVAAHGSQKHQAYASSKAALENLTLSFARVLAPHIKVNAIAPALLMFNERDDADYRAEQLAKSLMQIEPGAGEVLATLCYLLQSRYVTGQVVAVDGGRGLKLP
jgi:dihydromonapterin reductase/dihydrofolate reductase